MSRKLKKIIIDTVNESYEYHGKDATTVKMGIDRAGVSGSEWTSPLQLGNKNNITFVLRHIVAIYEVYQEEETS